MSVQCKTLQVFDAKSWTALMTRSILPKLGAGLAALQINPAHQPPESLTPWHHAMAWAPSLGAGQVLSQIKDNNNIIVVHAIAGEAGQVCISVLAACSTTPGPWNQACCN